MFGARYFGKRYMGARYFGPAPEEGGEEPTLRARRGPVRWAEE